MDADYEVDFVVWAESQAIALREGRFGDLDISNLAEEIEALARRDRRDLRSCLTTLAVNLLRLQCQPAQPAWRGAIIEQATRIGVLLKDSPSLRAHMSTCVAEAYSDARRQVAAETDRPLATFPATPSPQFERALLAALEGEAVE